MYYTFFSKKNKSVERESNIQKALSYYFSHEESIRAVAKRFEIHPSTFHGRLNGQHGPQMGRPSILSVEMETMIAGLLMELNDFEFGFNKQKYKKDLTNRELIEEFKNILSTAMIQTNSTANMLLLGLTNQMKIRHQDRKKGVRVPLDNLLQM